jgi:5,10-methylenetetrahydrofolate reductase
MAVQLKMSFEQNHNHFKTNLDNGNFMVLIEVSPPSQKRDYKLAVTKAMEIEYTVSVSEQVPAALAFSDKYDQPDSVNVVDFASEVCSSSRNRHLIYLSGRGTSFDEIVENTELCKSAGFSNIVAVSGDAFPGENIKQTHKRVFTESIHTLNYLKRTDEEGHFFPGCSINPFKYTVSDCFTQYFKLMKKINQGASFIVTQAGWDMLKSLECQADAADSGKS